MLVCRVLVIRLFFILLVLGLVARAQTPPVFGTAHGYQDAPFSLTLSAPGAIRYTLDGSAPTLANGSDYTAPLSISSTTVVRAVALENGLLSPVVTATYLFATDVIAQTGTPPGWPAQFPNGHATDYGMDPRVVSANSATIAADLRSLPALCVSFDTADFFSADTGIYVNPHAHGSDWERPMVMELIDPGAANGGGFSQPGAVRLRGGFSRDVQNPKHSFHFYFRDSTGGKLKFPLFGAGGAKTYERLDLRCATDWSWSFLGDSRCDFIRELWCRDTLGALGQPTTRGRFYQLFLNGQYWGLYCSQERVEADFAARYLGGSEADYDVVKCEPTDNYRIAASDGNLDAWHRLWNAANAGFISNAAYIKAQGLSAGGTPNPAFETLVEVDSLIAYMLVILYSGDQDAPISDFITDQTGQPRTGINNFFCARSRTDGDGFRFFSHDAEVTFVDLNVNRTGPFPAGDPKRGGKFERSNPQYLFQQLMKNAECRIRFADAVQRACFHGGPLSPAGAAAAFQARMAEIDRAVITESARWGDAKRLPADEPLGRADWLAICNGHFLGDYFPARTAELLAQLRAKGWFPNVEAADFSQSGGAFSPGGTLSLSALSGTILYTLDGSDPRQIGGLVSPAAKKFTAPFTLTNSVRVRARVLSGTTWSAMREFDFWPGGQDFSALRVSELHYDPLPEITPYGQVDGDNYEFIELHNSGATPLDLGGCKFAAGIEFVFPPGTILPGGRRIVLASDPDRFGERYPDVRPFDSYRGNFADGGETVTLAQPDGTPLISFTYDDTAPWPVQAAKMGRSLVFLGGAHGDPANWRASAVDGGAPQPGDEPAADFTGIVSDPLSALLTRNEPLTFQLRAAGFDTITNWELITSPGSGLPPGLALSTGGVISGAAATAGNFVARIRINGTKNGGAFSHEQDLRLIISTADPLDRTRPVALIGLPDASLRLPEDRPLLAGSATDASGIERVEWSLDGAPFRAAQIRALNPKKVTWSARMKDLAPGAHTMRVRALDKAGNWSAQAARSFTYIVPRPITVSVSGDGEITAGWAGTTLRELARHYTITAKPRAGFLFAGWTDGGSALIAESPALTFTMAADMTLVANFVANPFPAATTHRGLLTGAASTHTGRGMITLARTSTGTFSATLIHAGTTYRFTGRFNPATGEFAAQLPRKNDTPLAVALTFNFGPRNVSVSVGDLSGIAPAPFYHATNNPFPFPGTFKFSLPALAPPAPQSAGTGRLVATASGAISLTGTLADGTPFLLNARAREFESVDLYRALYKGGGSLSGVLHFDDADHARGQMLWSKPAAFEGEAAAEAVRQ